MPQKTPKRIAVRRKHSVPFPYVIKKGALDEDDEVATTPEPKRRRFGSPTASSALTPIIEKTRQHH